ncbi:MAG: hypothetical protein GY929_10670 [Actinomycetia bacterium]|nr:hypothetical protein [Actinomycetes bacterium]
MQFGLNAPANFPDDPKALGEVLLGAVESVRPVLEATAAETLEARTLAPAAVEAFHESGLFALKLPRELGGAEADPIVQMDVIEATALIDPSASWSMFITAAVIGNVGSVLPDEALAELFVDGRVPCMAATLRPAGQGRRVDGGYRVTGEWGWGSGIGYADHVSVLTFADEPETLINALVPLTEVSLQDNWHVMGMQGTGSCDYAVNDVFVPDLMVTDVLTAPQLRGGALYRLGIPGFVVNEHMIFALALARRTINELKALAITKKRGYVGGTTIADRPVVQRLISESELRLRACRLLCDEVLERLFAAAGDGPPPADLVAEARAVGTLCTDTAIDIVSQAFRHAGGSAVYLDSVFQHYLRDLYTIQSHFVVSDTSYEEHGQLLLEGG